MPVLTVRHFAPLMRQRVTVKPFSAYDKQGEATYGSGIVYRAAVVGEMKMVRTASGQEVPSQYSVYLMINAAIRPEDQITLSTSDVGSTESYAINPVILSVGRYPFLAGQFCTAIYLGGTHGGQGG